MPIRTLSHALAVALLLSAASPSWAEEDPPGETTKIVHLSHLEVNAATYILRTTLKMKTIAQDAERQTLVLRDTPERVEAAARLLRRMDVPPARWRATLIAVHDEGETPLRSHDLEQEDLHLRFGMDQAGADGLRLALEVHDVRDRLLHYEYQLTALLLGDRPTRLGIGESGEETVQEEDVLALVVARRQDHRQALGRLLGLDAPVHRVDLHLGPAGQR